MQKTSLDKLAPFDGFGVVDHSSPIPYYFQLITFIQNKIKRNEWKPGQILPSEQEFCEHLGISRTVVRQAMADLERQELVAKQNGKRTTIALPKYRGALMQNLQGFFEDALAKGQNPSTTVLDFRVTHAPSEIAEALQIKPKSEVIALNRLRYLDGVPEVLVATYIPRQMCPDLLKEDFSRQSLYQVLASKYHLIIAKGYRTIEAISAERGDAKLLQVKTGSPLLLLKSIGLLPSGIPLEFFVAKHRGDRAKFEVRLVRE